LAEMNVESYLGAPLLDMEGHVLGLVVVMKCTPMKDRQPIESILRIFAARIAAELQHKKTLEKIRGLESFPAENPGPVLRIRGDGIILYANQGSRPLLAYWGSQEGQTVPVAFLRKCIASLAENRPLELDMAFGEHEYSLLLAPNIKNDHVNVYGRDISERRQAQAQMVKLSSALEQIADSVIITNRQGVIEYVNPAFEATTGYSREEAIGNKPSLVKSGRHEPEFYQQLWRTILCGEIYRDMFINRKKGGALYYEEKTITPLKDSAGVITHFVSTGKDITRRMEAEERLHHLAYYDMLTNLPNRALFMDRIEHAMSRRRGSAQRLALLFLDLDRFKNINDTLGHDVGDRLLQTIARRITECVREGDTVARFGGDEFAILLEDVASSDAVGQVARKFIEVIEQPIGVDGHELFVTASIGISFFPDDADNANILLKNADTAMYRAKDTGRNTYQFYSREMGTKAFERLSLETSLRHALERGEFLLHYQPQVDIQSGGIIGVESLIRWQHPELGLVQPLKFIPLLEETGLIVPVGEWILETACAQLKAWEEVRGVSPRLSINLSGRQFFDPGLMMQLDQLLRKTGLAPQALELEITETVLMQNDRASRDNLGALQELGLRLSIDDFGTGYSSLSYLKRFPIDTLKIDRSFIRDLTIDPDDAAIVSAIIVMAHSLKLEVVAEGVETREQLDFLKSKQCDAMQGYLFSKPVSAQVLERMLGSE
ncbi:MAG: EAL domain-containing protein, partial [Gammaproteobacteria bacterium]